MKDDAASVLAEQFRELSDVINHDADPKHALTRLVQVAQRSIVGCDWAAITRDGPKPATLAATDDVARAVDALQLRSGEGPCITAAREAVVIHVPDLRTESRWPTFTRTALEQSPVRSILTFELDAQGARAALNLYAGHVGAYTSDSLTTAALFASHAQVALMHLKAASRSANLTAALATSRQIGAAVGILMSAHKVTAEQAFEMLRESSQRLNRKLSDAQEVTETGALP